MHNSLIAKLVGNTLSFIFKITNYNINASYYILNNYFDYYKDDKIYCKVLAYKDVNDECNIYNFIIRLKNGKVEYVFNNHNENELKTNIIIDDLEKFYNIFLLIDNKKETKLTIYFKNDNININSINDLLYKLKNKSIIEKRQLKHNEHDYLIDIFSYYILNKRHVKSNKNLDLYYTENNINYIFEFKTIDNNEASQMHKAIGQLEFYEYKYFINKNNKKILVLNKKPKNAEVINYCKYKNIKILYAIYENMNYYFIDYFNNKIITRMEDL